MKKISHLLSLFNILCAIFLLTSIVCSQFSSYGNECKTSQVELTKKTSSGSSSFTQLFCEEKEKEEENSTLHSNNHVFLGYLIVELLHLNSPLDQPDLSYQVPPSCGNTTDIPLYLAKRTFLI